MSTSVKSHKKVFAMIGLVFAVLFWAINAVVARDAVGHIPPMALSFYRWVVAIAILFPFAYKQAIAEKAVIKAHFTTLFWLALPSVAIYNSVLYLGALYTTATNISLVVAAMPAMTLAVAWMVNRDQPGIVKAIGIFMALGGVVVIIAQGSLETILQLKANPGDLLILVSIASWAVYSVLFKRMALPISPLPFLFMTMVLGILPVFPFYIFELIHLGGFKITWSVVGVFIYLGLCPSVLSYIFWNNGVKVLGASTASVSVYLIPVFTSAISYVYLGEALYSYHFFGGMLILAGLVLASKER